MTKKKDKYKYSFTLDADHDLGIRGSYMPFVRWQIHFNTKMSSQAGHILELYNIVIIY